MISQCDIIVVGAGPAGMMAALAARRSGLNVVLFEKNATLGRKLLLTGKGRCNITSSASLEDFILMFGSGARFLRHIFHQFFSEELLAFFKNEGLCFKTERQGRVFPETDNAMSVVKALQERLKADGVEVCYNTSIEKVLAKEGRVSGVALRGGAMVKARGVIVSTGGCSYPETGSTGNGFKMASKLGHQLTKPLAALVPMEAREKLVKDLQGLTVKNIRLTFTSGKRHLTSAIGELLFTHFGISGPLVLDLSQKISFWLDEGGDVECAIDFKPGLSPEKLDLKLIGEFKERGAVSLKNYLMTLLPKRLVAVVLIAHALPGERKCSQVSSDERRKIIALTKKFSLTITRSRPLNEAMLTSGGVPLKEVYPQTCESRKVKGLYFCGEVLDLAASSGGYNLQAAFSTGYVAGVAVAKALS